jgi:hypothetical protein
LGLIAHDEQVVSSEENNKIAATWKNATFITTTGLSHSMHDDGYTKKISQFISKNFRNAAAATRPILLQIFFLGKKP